MIAGKVEALFTTINSKTSLGNKFYPNEHTN